MCGRGFVKRFVPFLLTFVTGLFIASFFVNIAAPNLGFRGRSARRAHEIQRLKQENCELRNENRRLAAELQNLQRDANDLPFPETDVIEPFDAPPPPPPPPTVRTRHDH